MGSNPTAATKEEAPPVLIIDSGAIIGLARGDHRPRQVIEEAVEEGFRTIVPPVVITETTRGGPRDARVNQVLKLFDEVCTIGESTGRLGGRLLGRASSNAVVDALVVAAAIELGAGRIVTSDPDDLRALAADHAEVSVIGI